MSKPLSEESLYTESVEKYSTDKPDLRFGMECCTVTEIAKHSEFKVFLDVVKKEML